MNPLEKIPSANIPGVEFQFVNVTPELAAKWLQAAGKNRKLKKSTVAAYAADIRNGAWLTTHQGLAFNSNDRLIDGQHRLNAVVQARQSVTMLVSCGWPVGGKFKTMDAVDRGVNRSIADQLGIQHGILDAKRVVVVANAIAAACISKQRVWKSTTATTLELVAMFKDEIKFILDNPTKERGLKSATVAACLALCQRTWPEKTKDAMERLLHGENLSRDNSLLWLRNYLMGDGALNSDAFTVRQTTFHHLLEFVENRAMKCLCSNSSENYFRVLRLEGKRVRQVCDLYGVNLPTVVANDEPQKPVRKAISPIGAEAITIGMALAGPFTIMDLTARLDKCDNSGQWAMVWKNRGWIKPAGFGQFTRTATFGK